MSINIAKQCQEKALLPTRGETVEVLRLLTAADAFPRGGLFSGFYCVNGALRYEFFWQLVLRKYDATVVPPLDIALAWFLHRQRSASYARSIQRPCQQELLHPSRLTAFAFSSQPDPEVWQAAADEAPAWPPPPPGSEHDLTSFIVARRPKVALQLAESAGRFSWVLRSWLRPHFLDEAFLERAEARYVRFLQLRAANPEALLVPAADIALLWHTHLGLSGHYEMACRELLGAGSPAWEPEYLDLERPDMVAAYGRTAVLYEQMYGEPYSGPDTAWVAEMESFPLTAPSSPLAPAARAFADDPHAAGHAQRASLHAAEMNVALCGGSLERLFPPAGSRPRRSGAHALYAAWLASSLSGRFFDEHTCYRLCFTGSWSIRVATVERMVMSLVAVAHMRYLVDSGRHPFLLAIQLRKGLWRRERFAADAEHGCPPTGEPLPTQQQPAGMFSGAGFTMADMEAYLNSPAMCGLAALLEAAHAARAPSIGRGGKPRGRAKQQQNVHTATPPVPRVGTAPIWAILLAPAYMDRARTLFEHMWRCAVEKGVGQVMSYSEHELFYS